MKQEKHGLVNLNKPLAVQIEMLVEMLVEPLELDVVPVRTMLGCRHGCGHVAMKCGRCIHVLMHASMHATYVCISSPSADGR